MHRPDFVFRRDGISIRPYRCTLPTKMTKKNDDLHFKRFFQCFLFLIDVPSGKKERNFLLMYPLFVFPYLRTLRAVFSETMCFYADPRQGPGGCGLKGTWIRVVLFLSPLLMHPSVTSAPPSALEGLESQARRFLKICGGIFPSISSSSLL